MVPNPRTDSPAGWPGTSQPVRRASERYPKGIRRVSEGYPEGLTGRYGGSAGPGQGCSEVRPVEGRSCSAALKSEDRNPKPERRPKSEGRRISTSNIQHRTSNGGGGCLSGIGCWMFDVEILRPSDFGPLSGFGLRSSDFRAAEHDLPSTGRTSEQPCPSGWLPNRALTPQIHRRILAGNETAT